MLYLDALDLDYVIADIGSDDQTGLFKYGLMKELKRCIIYDKYIEYFCYQK